MKKYYKVGYTGVVGYNSINKIRIDGLDTECDEYYYKTNMYAYMENGRLYDFLTGEEIFEFDMDTIERGKIYYSALEEVTDLSEILGTLHLDKSIQNWYDEYERRLNYIRSEVAFICDSKNAYNSGKRRLVLEDIKKDKNKEF